MIELVTTYLEMTTPPKGSLLQAPPGSMVQRLAQPTVSFFRYLYNSIGDGGNGYWWVRRDMGDKELQATITRPGSEIYVLYSGGAPAGFYELDMAQFENISQSIELAFFGILPEFQGMGLGRFLLDTAVRDAWGRQPKRIWLHTCNYDSPYALTAYRKAGFHIYAQETEWIRPFIRA